MISDEEFDRMEKFGADSLHEVAKPAGSWSRFLKGKATTKDKRDSIVKIIDVATAGLAAMAVDFAAKFQRGAMTLAGWSKRFVLAVGGGSLAVAMAATGAASLDDADREEARKIVTTQKGYAEGFRHDLEVAALLLLAPRLAGALSSTLRGVSPGMVRRSELYGMALWGTAQALLRAKMHREGWDEERRIMGETSHHCGDCPAYARRGWVRVDDPDPLPAIGDSECMVSCRCHFEFRRSGTRTVMVPLNFHDRERKV